MHLPFLDKIVYFQILAKQLEKKMNRYIHYKTFRLATDFNLTSLSENRTARMSKCHIKKMNEELKSSIESEKIKLFWQKIFSRS